MNPITPAELAAYFDHTQLRAYAQRKDFEKLCAEAREYGFAMVAINPAPVSLCKDLLAGTSVHVGAAIGFPLGQSTPKVKKYEAVDAITNGADRKRKGDITDRSWGCPGTVRGIKCSF